ncbi:MAG: hypothetical protein OJF59_001525 [Cytophagales bacterium]|nr:hypothetical protein [Bacteroidota bacterium]MBS1980457.1 hypothetical protein [Bacteroidota bacterium]WHZ07772.1 MAG: hypothetical protein OJF59_001525 [Cytophagales bacterium]
MAGFVNYEKSTTIPFEEIEINLGTSSESEQDQIVMDYFLQQKINQLTSHSCCSVSALKKSVTVAAQDYPG